jgi:flagellar biogenesis protein FliO
MEFLLFGRLIGACIVVGLVLFVLQAVARRAALRSASPSPGGRIVAVLETTTLPGAASLHVVRVGERYLLVGRSASQVAALCDIPAEHVAAVTGAPDSAIAGSGTGFAMMAAAGAGFARRAFHACRPRR